MNIKVEEYARQQYRIVKYDIMRAKRDLHHAINWKQRFTDMEVRACKDQLRYLRVKQAAFKKLMPMRPKKIEVLDANFQTGYCPSCSSFAVGFGYCKVCGQNLMWDR